MYRRVAARGISIVFTFILLFLLLSAGVRESFALPAGTTGIPKAAADGNRATKAHIAAGTQINIKSGGKISALYIIWSNRAAQWTLEVPGKPAVRRGTGGFLHEFVELDQAVNQVVMRLGDKDADLAEIYVFTGAVPDWVQRWEPPLERCDLLVLSAHADDEFLWFGGTIPVYAGEYGKKVQVAYMTRHGKGSRAKKDYIRNHEMLDALWHAGVRNYPIISEFADEYQNSLKAALKFYGEDKAVGYVTGLLRRCKPDVVVTHGENGEYGHGVHVLTAYSLKKALAVSGDKKKHPDSAERYGIWKVKKAYLHQYGKRKLTINWDVPLTKFGGATGFKMAKESYRLHVSQQEKWFAVAARGSKYDCYQFGLYHTTVGDDVKKYDFFENISPVLPENRNKLAETTVKPSDRGKTEKTMAKPSDRGKTEKTTAKPSGRDKPAETTVKTDGRDKPSETAVKPDEADESENAQKLAAVQPAPNESVGFVGIFFLLTGISSAAILAVIILKIVRDRH